MIPILLIDDDIELGELLREYLASEGFAVVAVTDGEEGVQQALSQDFALIILDVMLPGISGFENRGVRCKVQDVGDVILSGDQELLASALENVIRNALYHTAEGTAVTVTLDRAQKGDKSWASIQVRDRGPGVPEEALAHLFEPFFRVSRRGAGSPPGSGLGLAITKRAVRLHHGTVKAWNAAEGGLVVEITLPLEPATPA